VRDPCKECGELIEAVISATCRVHDAQLQLDSVAKGGRTRKSIGALYTARVEERQALAALAAHQKACVHLAETNTT
jgi:hypothetical protein